MMGRTRGGSRGVRLRVDTSAFFFDRPAVQRALREMQADHRRYQHFAASIALTAKRSIRKVTAKPGSKAYKRPSRSPKPPRSRDKQHRLRRFMRFGFDYREKAMIVGPAFLPGTTSRKGQTVPSIHEKAKTAIIKKTIWPPSGKARSVAQAMAYRRLVKTGRVRPSYTAVRVAHTAKYPPRPFMVPAAKKMAPKFPEMWSTKLK